MFGLLKKLFSRRKAPREAPDPDALVFEKWEADFSDPRRVRFDIKSENSYDAYLRKGALVMGLKKTNCLAWVEDPLFRYEDVLIRGKTRLDSRGGYAAAGCMFRVVDEQTYYSLLISGKGYFRVDVVRNGSPLALIGWTELPQDEVPPTGRDRAEGGEIGAKTGGGTNGGDFSTEFLVVARGSRIVIALNGLWAAEINDATIPAGRICFVMASYEAAARPEPAVSQPTASPGEKAEDAGDYTAAAFLEALSLDSRLSEVEAAYRHWSEEQRPSPRSRFRLAETFAALGQAAPALVQIKRAWEDSPRKPRELLLAGKLALELELFDEAEDYIEHCLMEGRDSPEGKEAILEGAKFLYLTERFEELQKYGEETTALLPDSAALWTLLGHAYWSGGAYGEAAGAYDRAFDQDREDGVPAKNAARAYELLGRNQEALDRYLWSGRAFLGDENYRDLGELIPKLRSLGAESWEAHGLAGKWAFGVEDWAGAAAEFDAADKLRLAPPSSPGMSPPPDPAIIFLRGLLLLREGKRARALDFLEEAAALAPDYPLFRFKAAENRFLLSGDPRDPLLLADLEAALTLAPEDGWARNLAAQVCLSKGSLDEAAVHLETAVRLLGEVPAIRVNQAVLYYLQGLPDRALEMLAATGQEDPQGIMTNCAGNLLVRSGRFEEADAYYRRAIALAPDNGEYRCNRASCLIELERYGEADDVLSQAYDIAGNTAVLELITHVAMKKGEYRRAETVCRTALDMDPRHTPSLFSLGRLYVTAGRWEELGEILDQLEKIPLTGEAADRREELRTRMEDAVTLTSPCALCGRTWRVPRNPPPAPPIRLFAMPPDELPAGTCPECGGTYCIGCAKASLDARGRFLCPRCGKPLRLINGGLKKIVYDWAAGALPPS
jgi:tetratricopeptide (TPR) repeat protein